MSDISDVWQKVKKPPIVEPVLDPVPEEFSFYTLTVWHINQDTGEETTENIDGWTYDGTGLGYYQNPAQADWFTPVHLPTGMVLNGTFMTLENCQGYLRELAAKLDWHEIDESGPPKELMADLMAIEKKYTK